MGWVFALLLDFRPFTVLQNGWLVFAETASFPVKLKDFMTALSAQRLHCFGAVVIIIDARERRGWYCCAECVFVHCD